MINICSCSVSEHLYVIIFGVYFRRGRYCYFCANGFQSLTEKTLHRSTLLHTRLHIFHSSVSYWLGYVNSPATRPTTNLHFSDFISKAVQQCIDKYIKFITKRNCNMFPRKLVLTICDTANGRIACTLMATSNICEAIIRPCLVPSILVNSTNTLTYLKYLCTCIETKTFDET